VLGESSEHACTFECQMNTCLTCQTCKDAPATSFVVVPGAHGKLRCTYIGISEYVKAVCETLSVIFGTAEYKNTLVNEEAA
jgi:hypothetical protein